MDKISATEEALRDASTYLRDLEEASQSITQTCVAALEASLPDLDDTFASDINRFVKLIKAFEEKVSFFTRENTAALQERCLRIGEYERQTYKKRYFA